MHVPGQTGGMSHQPAGGSHPPSPTFSLSAQCQPCQNQKLSVWVWLQRERNKAFKGIKEARVMTVLFQEPTPCLWTFPPLSQYLPTGLPRSPLPRETRRCPPSRACGAAPRTSLLLCAPWEDSRSRHCQASGLRPLKEQPQTEFSPNCITFSPHSLGTE